jgi:hypothetical protein
MFEIVTVDKMPQKRGRPMTEEMAAIRERMAQMAVGEKICAGPFATYKRAYSASKGVFGFAKQNGQKIAVVTRDYKVYIQRTE